ncbi:putative C6 transcription factor [Aspergillus pseudotamarii]|uniref:Putative C6 transcription factor n=1 Tax=Aspergillus pseudotamarii TaxID=132259 RepID=A0A5N6TB30_ASPPS|nr:putative C6 transcription factor [Aspergillus pseudotamarii]KAE8143522.1 putative C6 transcription factor [Aspergillus pseudotamarii]
METLNPTTEHASTYGRACTNCYKAKCRCVRARSGSDCERCLRLKKKCQPSESVRRRHGPMAEGSDTRIARLEEKMESLLAAMQTFVSSSSSFGALADTTQPIATSNGALVNMTNFDFSTRLALSNTTVSTHPNQSPQSSSYATSPTDSRPNQEEGRLDYFRNHMLPYFPFIDLTPEMTTQYLRHNRPFLLRAIYTVTTFSTQERLAQVEELKHLLFTSALLKVESSIDMLLGLLTYIAWSTDTFLGRADLVSRLMMLAISLVYDLRLFKASAPDVQVMMAISQGQAEETRQSLDAETRCSLFEGRRAVLACFVLSSNLSSHLGRQDALNWTPQMEEALHILTINEPCPTDKLFVSQVRLQLFKQKAQNVRQGEEVGWTRTGTDPATASLPHLLYFKMLRRQLQELRSSFQADLHQTGTDILHAHAQYVELYINQLAYSISHEPRPLNIGGPLGFERFECLWQSVENIKLWLDSFDAIHDSKLIGQPFHFWSQMITSLTLLKYLSTLRDPEWDCQAVRNAVPLIATIDSMLQKLDQSSQQPELQCNDHLLHYLSKLLMRCRLWAEARWDSTCPIPEANVLSESDLDVTKQNSHIPDLDQIAWIQSMDLGDDQWLDNVLSIPTTLN